MNLFRIKLKDRRISAEHTIALYFEKPPDFSFTAGQYTDLILPPPSHDILPSEMKRDFSIASAPHEHDLMFAARVGPSIFKQTLASMPLGGEAMVREARGSFVLPNDFSRPVVLIAGGIGITPFRSMIVHAAYQNLPCKIFLFYSNHRPEDTAFLDELKEIEIKYPNFRMVVTMTDIKRSSLPWDGEMEIINAEILLRHLSNDLTIPIYYIAGPPDMVLEMRAMLLEAGVAQDRIQEEQFSGY